MRRTSIGSLLFLCISATALAQESRPAVERAELAKLAQKAFEDEKWEDAATHYRALVKVDEKNAIAWHHLGYSLHVQGKLDEALEAHLKAAELPRTRALGLYNAGCAHALKKDKDKAFEYLMKAAEAGFGNSDNLAEDTDLTELHGDPRWEKLVAAVKAAEEKGGGAQAFANSGERKASRIAWFGGKGSSGNVAVSFGPVAWKDDYEKLASADRFKNKRWRFGKDFWTTLDTNVPITVGDKKVAPGDYYLTIERKDSGDFVLAFNDAAEIRKLRLDAFQAGQTKGGVEVTLKHETLTTAASKLDIALSVDADDNTKGALIVQFGTHKLSAPITYHLTDK
jgi:tetratricopeptide (TPR) repeat protein